MDGGVGERVAVKHDLPLFTVFGLDAEVMRNEESPWLGTVKGQRRERDGNGAARQEALLET